MDNCSYCNKEINKYRENDYIWFSYGEGILCKECYQSYDKKIKSIEKKYKVKSGWVIKYENENKNNC